MTMNEYFNLRYKLSDEEFLSILEDMDYFYKYSIIRDDPYESLARLLDGPYASKIFSELQEKGIKVASILIKRTPAKGTLKSKQ